MEIKAEKEDLPTIGPDSTSNSVPDIVSNAGSEADIKTAAKEDPEKGTIRPFYGLILCLSGEFFYFFANFLLRWMTEYEKVSTDWTLMVKESVTTFTVLPIVIFLCVKKKYYFPAWKIFALIFLSAFVCEFFSSRAFVWSFALLGVVLAMPLYVTFQILGSNLFGAVLIKERFTRLKMITAFILIVAVAILSISKWESQNPSPDPSSGSSAVISSGETESRIIGANIDQSTLLKGILLTVIGGAGSAFYMCIMRGVMKPKLQKDGSEKQVPLTLSMLIICGSGMLIFAFCLLKDRGICGFYQVPHECWGIALGSGLANLIGFYFRNLGFRYVSASKIVFISVIQVLFLTVSGVWLFHESSNIFIWIGLALTICGIIFAGFSR
ncbi:MAG: EamA family transporter [Planctomycetia bacterium]|nr:EamA family transporter [Planctomycetia bacterium]